MESYEVSDNDGERLLERSTGDTCLKNGMSLMCCGYRHYAGGVGTQPCLSFRELSELLGKMTNTFSGVRIRTNAKKYQTTQIIVRVRL